jgi:hypothetical protein
LEKPIFDYQELLYEALLSPDFCNHLNHSFKDKHLWIKKATIPSSPKTEICSPNAGIVTVTGYFSSGLAKEGLSIPGFTNRGTLDGVTEQKISGFRTYDRGFSLIDSSSTTLGGLQAHKLEYVYKGNLRNVTLQTIDLCSHR